MDIVKDQIESKSHINDLLFFLKENFFIKEKANLNLLLRKVMVKRNRIISNNVTRVTIDYIDKESLNILFDDIFKEIVHRLIKSIISGEYVSEKKYSSKISEIEKYLNIFASKIESSKEKFSDAAHITFSDNYLKNILKPTNDILGRINIFIQNINVFTESPKYDILLYQKSFNRSIFDERKSKIINNLIVTLNVYLLDHNIQEDYNFYLELNRTKEYIENIDDKENYAFFNILLIKLNFLKEKWLYRVHKTQSSLEKPDSLEPAIIVGGELIQLSNTQKIVEENQTILNLGNSILSEWDEEIKIHYIDDKKYTNRIKELIFKIKFEPDYNNLSFKQLRLLIKYYKDIVKDSEKLHEICIFLEKKSQTSENYTLNCLYAYNCLLSLSIDLKMNESFTEQLYLKVKKIQKHYNIVNFFADLKYLQFIVKKYLSYFDLKDENNDLIIKLNIKKIIDLFENLEILFNQTCKHNKLLYNLEFEDKCIYLNEEGIEKVYFHSSIFLPIEFKINKNKISNIKEDIEKLKNFKNLFDILNADLKDLKQLKEEVKSNSSKMIENLAIFSGIISFIVGSISAFQFIETFIQALLFVVIFGTCISIFVLFIYISTSGIKTVIKNGYVIFFYITIGIIINFMLLPSFRMDLENNKLSKKNEKIIHKKFDSIHSDTKNLIKSKDSLTNELINKVNTLELKRSSQD